MKLIIIVKISFNLFTSIFKINVSAVNSLLTSQDFSIFTDIVPIAFDLNITIDTKVDTITVLIVKVAIVSKIVENLASLVGIEVDLFTVNCLRTS